MKEARSRGIAIDIALLSERLGTAVITIDVKTPHGIDRLIDWLNQTGQRLPLTSAQALEHPQLLAQAVIQSTAQPSVSIDEKIDEWVVDPLYEPLLLLAMLAGMSQLIFALGEPIKDFIETNISTIGAFLSQALRYDSLFTIWLMRAFLKALQRSAHFSRRYYFYLHAFPF